MYTLTHTHTQRPTNPTSKTFSVIYPNSFESSCEGHQLIVILSEIFYVLTNTADVRDSDTVVCIIVVINIYKSPGINAAFT